MEIASSYNGYGPYATSRTSSSPASATVKAEMKQSAQSQDRANADVKTQMKAQQTAAMAKASVYDNPQSSSAQKANAAVKGRLVNETA